MIPGKEKSMICCFFGHRFTPRTIETPLREAIAQQLTEHPDTRFYVGNHGEFDAMVRRVLKQMQTRYAVVLAYLPTEKDLTQQDDAYEDTFYPEGLEYTPKRYAILARNRWMLEQSDAVICYQTRDGGNTASLVRKAKKMGKEVIHILPTQTQKDGTAG